MKAPYGPLILLVFSALVFALCWGLVGVFTSPVRAVSAGVVLAGFTGLLIWFASTTRFAIARGIIALGSTAAAAPLASLDAINRQVISTLLNDEGDLIDEVYELDQLYETALTMIGVGLVVGVILIVIGGLMHRAPRG